MFVKIPLSSHRQFVMHWEHDLVRIKKSTAKVNTHDEKCLCEPCVLLRFDSRGDLGPKTGLSRLQILQRAIDLLGIQFDPKEEEVIRSNGCLVPRPF